MDHRAVSPIEMYSVARNNINFYKSVVFYLRFQADDFSLARIQECLRLTVEAQPRLRLQVDLSRTPAYYIVLPMSAFDSLPMEIITRSTEDDDEFLQGILENQTNNGFEYNQSSPLWRVILVISPNHDIFDLVLTFDHAIADGISGMSFFTTFTDCLAEKPTPTFSLDHDRPSYELISSKLPPISAFILKILEKILLPNFLSKYYFPKTYWAGSRQLTGAEPYRTRLLSFTLSNTALDSLHKQCRIEQTTVHSAILSSFILAITTIFGRENLEIFCGSAVDIRRFCQPIISKNQMGVYVSGVDSRHHIPYRENLRDLFWPLAREIKEQIDRAIEHEALPLIHSLRFVSDWKAFLLNQRQTLPNGYQNSIDISNLLRWSFESPDQSWKVLHGGFAQSANLVGSAFCASAVTVNDVLRVYISFQEHGIDRIEEVKSMRDRMKEFLIDAVY